MALDRHREKEMHRKIEEGGGGGGKEGEEGGSKGRAERQARLASRPTVMTVRARERDARLLACLLACVYASVCECVIARRHAHVGLSLRLSRHLTLQ